MMGSGVPSPGYHSQPVSKFITARLGAAAGQASFRPVAGNVELLKSAETRQVNFLVQAEGKTRCFKFFVIAAAGGV